MKLYGFWRSSATYRVYLALTIKGIKFDYTPVNLRENEQKSDKYAKIHPQRLVPALDLADGNILIQSPAILEYIEQTYNKPSLYPDAPLEQMRVREISNIIACEAQPFQNMRIQTFLRQNYNLDDQAIIKWLNQWVAGAMHSAEQLIKKTRGRYCYGDQITMADIYLIPQLYSAQKFGVDTSQFKVLNEIASECSKIEAFERSHPEIRPDAP